MASREYLLRASIELEHSGSRQIPAPDLRAIEDLFTARIGTELPLNSGLFTRLTSGSYRYEMIITTDIGFNNTIYTVRWSKDRTITFISLPELDQGDVESLQSSTRSKPGNAGFNKSILRTSYTGGNRVERQLNLSQAVSSSDLHIETQRTESGPSTRREVLTPRDPILSSFFLTPPQLLQLESRLKAFNLRIQGVSDRVDVLVLIRRENLSISVSSEGIIIKIPGLGTFDLTGNSVGP